MRQISYPRIRALLVLSLACLLQACSPELDWRELISPEGRFKVLMPARPSMASGADAAGHVQNSWTAEAGPRLFSVGYTDYRDAAQLHMQPVRDALVRAVRGKLVQEVEIQSAPAGLSLTIQGWAGDGSDRVLLVWLFPRGARLYQLAIAATPGSISPADSDLFLLSFKPE